MLEVVRYACSDWTVTPVAPAANEAEPADIREQRFMLTLSGVAVIAFVSDPQSWPWKQDTLHIRPETDAPLEYAIARYQIPTPAGNPGYQFTQHFQVEQIASLAGLASVEGPPDKVIGFACDAWRAHPFETRTDAFTSGSLPKLFAGIDADLAIWAGPGRIHRINFHITLIGKIAFAPVVLT